MITKEKLSSEKLRGGFYSPPKMVNLALERAFKGLSSDSEVRILEPSCGDGAFIDGLARMPINFSGFFEGVELIKEESEKSKYKLEKYGINGRIINRSFFLMDKSADYDVVIGNPPYLRYQFINDADKSSIEEILSSNYIQSTKVANIWIPLVISALSKLKTGGRFALIIPDESMTGISAMGFRNWIVSNFNELQIDIFPVGSFPDVLQETLIFSGRRGNGDGIITFSAKDESGRGTKWSHTITDNSTWSRYLLNNRELEIYNGLSQRSNRLIDGVKFDVSIVTGANQYFCVNGTTLRGFEMEKWGNSLLPRLRMAPGLIYTPEDHQKNIDSDESAYILNFGSHLPDPSNYEKPSEYIAIGEEFEINKRHKCSIRQPWYRVPNMISGEIMLSKRSHYSPRVVLNDCNALTTDTIYRGKVRPLSGYGPHDIVASFHSSLTLLSAEIEGRSFGGGVLELVPSEVSRLRILFVKGFGKNLEKLDKIFRRSQDESFEDLIEETDRMLVKMDSRISKSDVEILEGALRKMRSRRFERN